MLAMYSIEEQKLVQRASDQGWVKERQLTNIVWDRQNRKLWHLPMRPDTISL